MYFVFIHKHNQLTGSGIMETIKRQWSCCTM